MPVSPDLADSHEMVLGHPVVADEAGRDLFIQVTQTGGGTFGKDGKPSGFRWHISVNNPLDRPVTTQLRRRIPLPALLPDRWEVTLRPGEYRVLVGPP